MAYVPVPKDLTNVKTKVLFNLTKRQLICFGSGALIGVPLFFALKSHTGVSTAAICMILVMLPFFLFAMYERNGQPLEKILRNIIRTCFLRPKQRPYETNNFYAVLERQDRLDKEVYQMALIFWARTFVNTMGNCSLNHPSPPSKPSSRKCGTSSRKTNPQNRKR